MEEGFDRQSLPMGIQIPITSVRAVQVIVPNAEVTVTLEMRYLSVILRKCVIRHHCFRMMMCFERSFIDRSYHISISCTAQEALESLYPTFLP
jgi:hypothetical protein